MSDILKTIDILDDSKFKEIKRHLTLEKKAIILHDNLWSMFNLDYYSSGKYKSDEDRFIDALDNTKDTLSVTNFAWTENVMEAFYKHPYNIVGVRSLKSHPTAFQIFQLNSEPVEKG